MESLRATVAISASTRKTCFKRWENLALLYGPGQAVPTLAPFYDLISIEFLNLLRPRTWARDMAFSIGEHHEPERIARSDWLGFARELGMPPRRLLDRVRELATALPGVARATREAFAQVHGGAPVYDRLEEAVRRRCRWTLESLASTMAQCCHAGADHDTECPGRGS